MDGGGPHHPKCLSLCFCSLAHQLIIFKTLFLLCLCVRVCVCVVSSGLMNNLVAAQLAETQGVLWCL